MSEPSKEAIEAAERLLSCAAYSHLRQSWKENAYVAEHFQAAINRATEDLQDQLVWAQQMLQIEQRRANEAEEKLRIAEHL